MDGKNKLLKPGIHTWEPCIYVYIYWEPLWNESECTWTENPTFEAQANKYAIFIVMVGRKSNHRRDHEVENITVTFAYMT